MLQQQCPNHESLPMWGAQFIVESPMLLYPVQATMTKRAANQMLAYGLMCHALGLSGLAIVGICALPQTTEASKEEALFEAIPITVN